MIAFDTNLLVYAHREEFGLARGGRPVPRELRGVGRALGDPLALHS